MLRLPLLIPYRLSILSSLDRTIAASSVMVVVVWCSSCCEDDDKYYFCGCHGAQEVRMVWSGHLGRDQDSVKHLLL